jgi:hypothetical protein
MFKRTLNMAEKKESHSSKDSDRRRQRREEVVAKKHALAEWRQAKAAAWEAARDYASQQDATAGAPDADLNNCIEEIEYDMVRTFEEFKNI